MLDLTLTRIFLAEHSYPTPTRNHLSQHARELAKARVPVKPKATECRYGYRAKDGTNYMFPTASEREQYRREELANQRLERVYAAERLSTIVGTQTADVDSWAHKS